MRPVITSDDKRVQRIEQEVRIDLVAQRPDLRGLRRAFRIGEPALRAQRLRLRLDRDIEGAPADVEEQPGDRRIERVPEALHRIELANLRHGQDQRLLARALDLDLVALLDDGEAFARLEPELLLALVHQVFERDDRARP